MKAPFRGTGKFHLDPLIPFKCLICLDIISRLIEKEQKKDGFAKRSSDER